MAVVFLKSLAATPQTWVRLFHGKHLQTSALVGNW
jgi:hypothetical protein